MVSARFRNRYISFSLSLPFSVIKNENGNGSVFILVPAKAMEQAARYSVIHGGVLSEPEPICRDVAAANARTLTPAGAVAVSPAVRHSGSCPSQPPSRPKPLASQLGSQLGAPTSRQRGKMNQIARFSALSPVASRSVPFRGRFSHVRPGRHACSLSRCLARVLPPPSRGLGLAGSTSRGSPSVSGTVGDLARC